MWWTLNVSVQCFFHLKLWFFKRISKIANWDSEKFPSPPDRREPLAGEIASLHRSLSSPRKDLQIIANLRGYTILEKFHLQEKIYKQLQISECTQFISKKRFINHCKYQSVHNSGTVLSSFEEGQISYNPDDNYLKPSAQDKERKYL